MSTSAFSRTNQIFVLMAALLQSGFVPTQATTTSSDVVFTSGRRLSEVSIGCDGPDRSPPEERLSPFFRKCESKIAKAGFDSDVFAGQEIVATIRAKKNIDDPKVVEAVYADVHVQESTKSGGEQAAVSLLKRASPYPLPENALPFERGILVRLKYPVISVTLIPEVNRR